MDRKKGEGETSLPCSSCFWEFPYFTSVASGSRPGLLILADLFYPGWRAELDGQPVEILRVNYVLRGIALPPGEHRVVFRFAPTSLYTGLGMTLAGLVVLAACFSWEAWACYRRRRPV